MGEVVNFPRERTCLGKKPYWRIVDLLGKKPRGHTPPSYGPRGRVLMAKGQVWVEGHNQRLWVVSKMVRRRQRKGSLYPHDVTLAAYRGAETRTMCEASVRLNMSVWDIHAADQARLMRRLENAAARGSHPSCVVRSFFGFDREGNRID